MSKFLDNVCIVLISVMITMVGVNAIVLGLISLELLQSLKNYSEFYL